MVNCEVDVHNFCLEKTKLNNNEVYSTLTNEETPLDSKVGPFFLCIWKTKGVMENDGSINMLKLQDFSEAELNRVRDITDDDKRIIKTKLFECNLLPRDKQEETAIKIKNCHMKTVVGIITP